MTRFANNFGRIRISDIDRTASGRPEANLAMHESVHV
jgi:hypothetical protein